MLEKWRLMGFSRSILVEIATHSTTLRAGFFRFAGIFIVRDPASSWDLRLRCVSYDATGRRDIKKTLALSKS